MKVHHFDQLHLEVPLATHSVQTSKSVLHILDDCNRIVAEANVERIRGEAEKQTADQVVEQQHVGANQSEH